MNLFIQSQCGQQSPDHLTEKNGKAESAKGFAKATVRRIERLGMNAGLTGNGHKIRIANPAGKRVQMKVAGNACACRAAEIHSVVHAVWFV